MQVGAVLEMWIVFDTWVVLGIWVVLETWVVLEMWVVACSFGKWVVLEMWVVAVLENGGFRNEGGPREMQEAPGEFKRVPGSCEIQGDDEKCHSILPYLIS